VRSLGRLAHRYLSGAARCAAVTEGIHMRFSVVGALLAALALVSVAAGSAGAHEWHTDGQHSFASTNAGPSRLAVHNGASTVLVECSSSTVTGTINGPTSMAFPWLSAATLRPAFGGPCTVSGTPGFSVTCGSAEFTAISYVGGHTYATSGGGVTTGRATSIDCVIGAGATQCSTVTGSMQIDYINPASTSASGTWTSTPAGAQIEVTKIGAGCTALPNGTGTFGRAGPGSTVTDHSFTVDGPHAPYIYTTF
jgi:hypothetical protein